MAKARSLSKKRRIKRGDGTPAVRKIIGPTPERAAKAEGFLVKGDIGIVMIQDAQIERLFDRGVIDERQRRAAEKVYRHWYESGMEPSYASLDLQRGYGGGGNDCAVMPANQHQAEHRSEYRVICRVLGLRIGRVVEDIVCRDKSPAEAGRSLGWANEPQARAAAVENLRIGLDLVAKEYGL